MGSENQTTTPWTLTNCNAKTCPHNRSVFGLTSLANTLTQEPQEARLNSKGALDRNLVHSKKFRLDKKQVDGDSLVHSTFGGGGGLAIANKKEAKLNMEKGGE